MTAGVRLENDGPASSADLTLTCINKQKELNVSLKFCSGPGLTGTDSASRSSDPPQHPHPETHRTQKSQTPKRTQSAAAVYSVFIWTNEDVTDASFNALKEHALSKLHPELLVQQLKMSWLLFLILCSCNLTSKALTRDSYYYNYCYFFDQKVGFSCHNCRETQESGVEFTPQLLTLPPPGTCFILSLEPHLDCTVLKSNFWSRICTWKNKNVIF